MRFSWSTSGAVGFKGLPQVDSVCRGVAAESAGRKAQEHGMRELEVNVKGPGSGRETALRALQAIGFVIRSIKDVTPLPHNGVKQRKRRRV